jgi:hypothetical protein
MVLPFVEYPADLLQRHGAALKRVSPDETVIAGVVALAGQQQMEPREPHCVLPPKTSSRIVTPGWSSPGFLDTWIGKTGFMDTLWTPNPGHSTGKEGNSLNVFHGKEY